MRHLRHLIDDLKTDRRGATAIEYALIAGLIAVAIAGSLTTLGGALELNYQDTADQIDAVGGG